MYRILIADDEGLMLEAFKGVILAEFGDKCSVETGENRKGGNREGGDLSPGYCVYGYSHAWN